MLIINLILIALLILLRRIKNKLINVRLILRNTAIFEFAWASFLFLLLIVQLAIATEESELEKSIASIINEERATHLSLIALFGIIHLSIFIYLVRILIRKKI